MSDNIMKLEKYIELVLGKGEKRKTNIWYKSPFKTYGRCNLELNKAPVAFKVNTKSQLWYCFETQQGGNLEDFIEMTITNESKCPNCKTYINTNPYA